MSVDQQLAELIDTPEATDRWQEFEALLRTLPEEDVPPTRSPIPVTGAWVNLGALHPELRRRLGNAMADSRISSIARVSSGVRTYAQQLHLYRTLPRGRAANPDYVGPDGRKGSKHMVQAATWRYAPQFAPCACGYAVDVGFWNETNAPWSLLRSVMADHGLRLTVFQPFEPWHFELDPSSAGGSGGGSGQAPAASGVLRIGSSGSAVRDLQQLLSGRNDATPRIIPPVGVIDGLFGPATGGSLQGWQRYLGIDADGAYGPQTRQHTDRWQSRRAAPLREGMRGDAVEHIQTYLGERHQDVGAAVPDPGGVDGHFGPNTTASVTGWQRHLSLAADGVWGPATWAGTDGYDNRTYSGAAAGSE